MNEDDDSVLKALRLLEAKLLDGLDLSELTPEERAALFPDVGPDEDVGPVAHVKSGASDGV